MTFSARALAAALLLVAAAPAGATADVSVQRVSFDRSHDGRTTVARVHTTDRVRAYSVDQDGTTLELVLFRARLAPSLRREGAEGPVQTYHVEAAGDRVTVRFQVDAGVYVRAYPDRDSDHLLLAFSADPPPRPTAWGRPTPAVRTPPAAVTRPPITRAAMPAPAEPVAAASAVPDAGAEHWRLDTVVLDAGHGGHDHGGVGNGTSDKEVAFGVVSRLGPMLERELGVRVVYTRPHDRFVELRERGRIANREGGKVFISVHANSAASPSARGTETFFLSANKSANAREVMERENSVVELESAPELYADFHDEDDIVRSLAMSAYQEESQELARLIEGEFVRSGRHSRGVKQGPFLVLWAASMPAVLVEVGFVSNREEARYISSERGLDETARSIFNAVRAYKESYERGTRLAVGGQ